MPNLIITVIAILIQAASLYALMAYSPAWVKQAPDRARVVAAGLSSFEHAFFRYGDANSGTVPEPNIAADGGLSQFQTPTRHLAFLPKAPDGFAWKYGRAGDLFICLESTDAVNIKMDKALFKGIQRLQKLLPENQLVISAGAMSCGSSVDVGALSIAFPADLSVTYFLRYAPGVPPSTAVLPCKGTDCIISDKL